MERTMKKRLKILSLISYLGYWDIPMKKLITEGYVSTKNQKGKQVLLYFCLKKLLKKFIIVYRNKLRKEVQFGQETISICVWI